MALEITREELRSDIREIATASATSIRGELRADLREFTTASVATQREDLLRVTTEVAKENNHRLVRMISGDLDATNNRMSNLNRRLAKRLDMHIEDPHTHGTS